MTWNESHQDGPTLAEVSEEELLAGILPGFARTPAVLVGPGDDAAVLRDQGPTVVTTDAMVRGSDWLDAWSSPADVAVKSLTQNLADVAAMGAAPTSVVVTLVAEPRTPLAWVQAYAAELGRAATEAGVAVIGGDLSSAPEGVLVSITAMGVLEGRAPVLRSGARPGDVLAVAGTLGRSGAGLALLLRGGSAPEENTRHHLRPVAPLAAGPQAAAAGATAMLDVSDGLLRDAHRLASASQVALELSREALRADVSVVAAWLDDEDVAWEVVLTGGEEHSLLATFPAAQGLPPGWREIGRVLPGSGVNLDGVAQQPRGWDHFAG